MIYWDIFWLHIVKKMYEATNITRGTGFFFLEIDGNWCRRPTLCEKVVGITDQLLTTDLRMCRIGKWGWHQSRHGNFTTHIITYIYRYTYIYTYIYIHVILQNQAQSCTSWLIWVCCDMLWCDQNGTKTLRLGLLDALSVSQRNRRSSCTIRSSTSAWVAGRGAGHP